MTPIWKKTKLHIIATVTVCGLMIAVVVPSNEKGSSAQTVNHVETVENVDMNELAYDVLNIARSEESATNEVVPNILNADNPYAKEDTTTSDGETVDNPEEEGVSHLLSMEAEDSTISHENLLENVALDATEGEEATTPEEEIEDEKEEEPEEEPAPKFYTVGVVHSSVAEIQQRLMDLGFMDYAEPTDYYGSITSESVKMFQRQNDLKQDGIIGPDTKEMLLSEDAKKYTAKLGMEGSDIKRIQTRLYEMGYLATADQVTGYFGDVTEAAVKKMQENNGLSADGKVGIMTTELLYSGEAKPNLISYGEKSDIVLAAQERLKELGYLTTTPDGTYGNDTMAAVKQFQSRNDLVVDGYLGPSTRDVLNSSSAVSNGLILGDSGDTVKRVQELLIKYGYLTSGSNTGYFGDATEAAVKSFQRNNGLGADGNVGVRTMSKLTSSDVVKASSQTSSNTQSSQSSSNQTSSNQSSNQSSSNQSSNSSNSSGNTSNSNTSSNSGSMSASVSSLISVAKSKLGKPYVYGAKGPNSFDCSGFVYWCLNQIGVKQSYLTSSGWKNVGKYKRISSFSNIKAGDIVVVRGHVGIAAGNGMVIDASSSSGKIVYRELGSWWSSNFIVAWRIFD